MNARFLGDAMGYWKGSLIRILADNDVIHDLAVEPMITGREPWTEEDLLTYRRLLGLRSNIICHEYSIFSGRREQYFRGTEHDGDLLLDPDTGIYTGVRVPTRKHITVPEIRCLLERHETCTPLLIVYQHSARGLLREKLMGIQKTLLQEIPGTRCIAYEGGCVAMFFISKDRARIQCTYNALREHLTGTAENRVLGRP